MDCPLHDERLTLAGLFMESHAGLVATLERRLEAECPGGREQVDRIDRGDAQGGGAKTPRMRPARRRQQRGHGRLDSSVGRRRPTVDDGHDDMAD